MSARHYFFASVAIGALGVFSPAQAEESPQRGAKIYGACAACHSLEPNLHLTGPSLAGLWGKKAASVADFPRYSRALKEQDFVWDEVTLNAWIADPKAFVTGNSMTFRGIGDDKARGDLVAFLKLALAPNGGKSTVAQGLITAELARGQVPEPLGTAGPDELVTAARHCQNTFFVVTADGREHAFWELNLRLKVDTGATGPKAGKPVLMPAGMQGDRASLVFADPAQISSFIERRC